MVNKDSEMINVTYQGISNSLQGHGDPVYQRDKPPLLWTCRLASTCRCRSHINPTERQDFGTH
jgi:hypothetical protein